MRVIANVCWKKTEYKREESNKESPLPHGRQHKKSIQSPNNNGKTNAM